jgi:hypothetical protein
MGYTYRPPIDLLMEGVVMPPAVEDCLALARSGNMMVDALARLLLVPWPDEERDDPHGVTREAWEGARCLASEAIDQVSRWLRVVRGDLDGLSPYREELLAVLQTFDRLRACCNWPDRPPAPMNDVSAWVSLVLPGGFPFSASELRLLDQFSDACQRLHHAAVENRPGAETSTPADQEHQQEPDLDQRGIALVLANPGKSVLWYAKQLGCARTTLYRHPLIMKAIDSQHGSKRDRRRGHASPDGGVEGYDGRVKAHKGRLEPCKEDE